MQELYAGIQVQWTTIYESKWTTRAAHAILLSLYATLQHLALPTNNIMESMRKISLDIRYYNYNLKMIPNSNTGSVTHLSNSVFLSDLTEDDLHETRWEKNGGE